MQKNPQLYDFPLRIFFKSTVSEPLPKNQCEGHSLLHFLEMFCHLLDNVEVAIVQPVSQTVKRSFGDFPIIAKKRPKSFGTKFTPNILLRFKFYGTAGKGVEKNESLLHFLFSCGHATL